jgi:dihydroorotase
VQQNPAEPFDLVLRGGRVIDPAQGIDAIRDVGIRHGRIAAVAPALDTAGCPDARDAAGTYICPGLVDLHGHWYEGGLYGIRADIGLNHGVTTAVDAGSTGFANFPEFRRTAMAASRTRLLAFVHISFLGLHAPFAEELLELRYARPIETAAIIEAHPGAAVGVKVRIGAMTGDHGNTAFDLAREAADSARVPLMVHISTGADERYILDHLRPGDILTHCFHGRGNGMLAQRADGFIAEVQRARERGVIFDIGHGCGSFSWETAQRAFEHYFWPDTISTDLHRYSVDEPWCVTLPNVISKFLCLGMTLNDAIAKTTSAPAAVLQMAGEIGSLRAGSVADLLQFRVREGDFAFTDADLKVRRGNRLVEPLLTVRGGVAYRSGEVRVCLRQRYACDELVFGATRHRAGEDTPPHG